MSDYPILYSFRRCPYAMRARMALLVSETPVRLREVVLRDKPDEMLAVSPKGTVPVLVLENETVIDESLDVMLWALEQNDPEHWLAGWDSGSEWVAEFDDGFKFHLDRYKYPNRYENVDPEEHRSEGLKFLKKLDARISSFGQIAGQTAGMPDFAIFPFVRQFANHDRNWFDGQDLPHLQKWLAGHLASDLFQAIMTKYAQWQTGDEEPIFGREQLPS